MILNRTALYFLLPIEKYGDGSAVREFTYIDDIIQGVLASIDLPSISRYKVFNLGGGTTHTLNEFVECVEKHVGKKAIIKELPNQMGDVPLTSANQDFSNKFLGFEPKWTLDKGIEETVKWYYQNKKVNSLRIFLMIFIITNKLLTYLNSYSRIRRH